MWMFLIIFAALKNHNNSQSLFYEKKFVVGNYALLLFGYVVFSEWTQKQYEKFPGSYTYQSQSAIGRAG